MAASGKGGGGPATGTLRTASPRAATGALGRRRSCIPGDLLCRLVADRCAADASCLHALDGSWLRLRHTTVLAGGPRAARSSLGAADGSCALAGRGVLPQALTQFVVGSGAGMRFRLCLCRRDPNRPFTDEERRAARDLVLRPLLDLVVADSAGTAVLGSPSNRSTGDLGPPQTLPDPWRSLSSRERRVAELLASGISYKEVAACLGIAPGTVRTYVGRLFSKLRVSGRAELARTLGPSAQTGDERAGRGSPTPTMDGPGGAR